MDHEFILTCEPLWHPPLPWTVSHRQVFPWFPARTGLQRNLQRLDSSLGQQVLGLVPEVVRRSGVAVTVWIRRSLLPRAATINKRSDGIASSGRAEITVEVRRWLLCENPMPQIFEDGGPLECDAFGRRVPLCLRAPSHRVSVHFEISA